MGRIYRGWWTHMIIFPGFERAILLGNFHNIAGSVYFVPRVDNNVDVSVCQRLWESREHPVSASTQSTVRRRSCYRPRWVASVWEDKSNWKKKVRWRKSFTKKDRRNGEEKKGENTFRRNVKKRGQRRRVWGPVRKERMTGRIRKRGETLRQIHGCCNKSWRTSQSGD